MQIKLPAPCQKKLLIIYILQKRETIGFLFTIQIIFARKHEKHSLRLFPFK